MNAAVEMGIGVMFGLLLFVAGNVLGARRGRHNERARQAGADQTRYQRGPTGR
jgi:hypothetical protein